MRADITEFEFVYLNAVRYTLGPLTEVPGGTVWLKRILNYPENSGHSQPVHQLSAIR